MQDFEVLIVLLENAYETILIYIASHNGLCFGLSAREPVLESAGKQYHAWWRLVPGEWLPVLWK